MSHIVELEELISELQRLGCKKTKESLRYELTDAAIHSEQREWAEIQRFIPHVECCHVSQILEPLAVKFIALKARFGR